MNLLNVVSYFTRLQDTIGSQSEDNNGGSEPDINMCLRSAYNLPVTTESKEVQKIIFNRDAKIFWLFGRVVLFPLFYHAANFI